MNESEFLKIFKTLLDQRNRAVDLLTSKPLVKQKIDQFNEELLEEIKAEPVYKLLKKILEDSTRKG